MNSNKMKQFPSTVEVKHHSRYLPFITRALVTLAVAMRAATTTAPARAVAAASSAPAALQYLRHDSLYNPRFDVSQKRLSKTIYVV